MKLFASFRPRERRLILGVLALLGCWILVSWLVEPLWQRVAQRRDSMEAQTEKLRALSRLLAQSSAIADQYEQVATYLEPTAEGGASRALWQQLEALSSGSNTHLNLKPLPEKQEEHVIRHQVELDVEGTQQDLLRFLDGLFRLPRLMVIERLRLTSLPTKGNGHALRATILVHVLQPR